MNGLTLVIVNEGSLYPGNVATARLNDPLERFQAWAYRVRAIAEELNDRFGEGFTVAKMAEAVAQLEDYYQDHIKEL